MGSRSTASSAARRLFSRKLTGKSCRRSFFTRFAGLAPYRARCCARLRPLPIGARLLLQKESPTQLAGHSKFSPYGNSERYATTIRTCFCRVFRNLYMSKVNFFHKMCQKPGIEPPTSLACSFFLRSQAHHPF